MSLRWKERELVLAVTHSREAATTPQLPLSATKVTTEDVVASIGMAFAHKEGAMGIEDVRRQPRKLSRSPFSRVASKSDQSSQRGHFSQRSSLTNRQKGEPKPSPESEGRIGALCLLRSRSLSNATAWQHSLASFGTRHVVFP